MLAHSDQDIIRLLLDHGADVHHSSSTGTVAHVAAFTGWNSAAIEMLIDAGLDVNKKGAHGITPLMEASSSRYLHVVQQLLELEDININDVDDEGRSALFYAATSNNEETMQALLGAGINPNIQANNGDTAFHCVCSRLRIVSDKTLKYFAVAGADITLKNGVGKRALTAESIEGLDKKECRSLLKIFPQAAKYLVL
jgi:ankyrin repeat protein